MQALVREEADENVPKGNASAAYFTIWRGSPATCFANFLPEVGRPEQWLRPDENCLWSQCESAPSNGELNCHEMAKGWV
ncbi:hypothetical protein KDH_01040 [Dictyobacter sp. S3.2.2.5]|uniref:Uncharacterized protein n=1 Tax=Dictyobacter halimunensis TaxID=3026934 RepID=A0ABQ6FJA2_9CHLR|nr:hypothetical protein KDH_01040 [Dictyobacter sp. S3.2.2.5]